MESTDALFRRKEEMKNRRTNDTDRWYDGAFDYDVFGKRLDTESRPASNQQHIIEPRSTSPPRLSAIETHESCKNLHRRMMGVVEQAIRKGEDSDGGPMSAAAATAQDTYIADRPFPVSNVITVDQVLTASTAAGADGSDSHNPSRPHTGSNRRVLSPAKSQSPPMHPAAGYNNNDHHSHGHGHGYGHAHTQPAAHYPPGTKVVLSPADPVLIRSLEDRLGHALRRVSELERQLGETQHELSLAVRREADLLQGNKMVSARNEELSRQLALLRDDCFKDLKEKEKAHEKEIQEEVKKAEGESKDEINGLKAEVKDLEKDKKELENDRKRLTDLVVELRHQLQQNAAALQTQTTSIRDLNNELLKSKHHSSSMSVGYQRLESELRDKRIAADTAKGEVTSLKHTLKELQDVRERNGRGSTDHGANDRVRELQMEKDRLSTQVQSLNEELSRQRVQMDNIRQQANNAFNECEMLRNADNSYEGPGAYNEDRIKALLKSVEDEERKNADESRRWRQSLRV